VPTDGRTGLPRFRPSWADEEGPSTGSGPRRPDGSWSAWFDGLQVTSDDEGQTSIAGPVTDQAALHGLLAKVRDLGLELLEVDRIDPD
jgi:hypothetical protein